MPVARYFLFVGSALVALLLLADWMWSAPAPVQQASTETGATPNSAPNDVTLRIHSGQKWPEKVVFDTAVPTIIPPVAPPVAMAASAPAADQAVSAETAGSQLVDARAEMKPAPQPTPAPKRLARAHHHHRGPQRGPTWVAANPPGWGSWNW